MTETTIESLDSVELLDQILDDLAGEEFSEFHDDLAGLDSELELFTEIDHFAEIDSYH